MKLPTVKQEFDSLIAAAFKDRSPPGRVQLQEMERMFFSGYLVAFNTTMFLSDKLSEEEAARQLEMRQREVEDYIKLLGKIPGTTEVQ